MKRIEANERKRRLDEMSPKIKMSDIHDDRDEDIIELTEDELKEILADDDFEDDGEYEEIRSFAFTNPDPYAKVEPRPDDAPKRDFSFDEKGSIVVKNPSAFWLPQVTIVDEVGGTEYTVTGSYDGSETLDKKLKRIMEHNASDAADNETDITEDGE